MITNKILEQVIVSQRNTLESLELGTTRKETKETKAQDSFALIIMGIRRCGKSTLLHQLIKKEKIAYYLNLEDPRLDGFQLSDFNKIELLMKKIYGERGTYFLDEIQNVEKWEKFVRYLVDKKEKVILTGSNASLLSKELGTKLTGRNLKIEMFPFSFNEFSLFYKEKPSLKLFYKYLYKGGFPEYLKLNNPEILNNLLSEIVIKDIAIRFKIKNTKILNKIAIFLSSHVGKEFSYNSIKKMFDIKSLQSVIDYISFFEDAYLIFTLPKFSYSYKVQQISPKKAYSIDNGFSYKNTTSFSKDLGKMLENMVFLHLRRKYHNIFYFQEKGECDFVIKENEKITQAVQVCYDFNEENKNREINGLLEAMEKFDLKKGLILTYDQEDNFNIKGRVITLVPAWKWMLK